MAGGVGGGKGGLKAEINVTPLVDVVLVLLIIFMVVTPMLTRGKNVQLPVASSADVKADEAVDALVLTISANKSLWLESDKVTLDKLPRELKARLGPNPTREVLVKADSTVTLADMRPVLQKLKAANLAQISFAVLEQGGGQ